MKQEEASLSVAKKHFEELINNFNQYSTEQIIKKLIAILSETVLGSIKNLADGAFELLEYVATKVVEFLDTPLEIPVISYLLKQIGVTEFSILA